MSKKRLQGALEMRPTRFILIGSIALMALVFTAFWPAMGGGFLWDDDAYVQHNPTLRSLGGLARIWLEPGATPQYYPLVFTTFWFEWRLWGADPMGYHLVNCWLHAVNAILLWHLLVKLDVPSAWFAAAVFALHPVHVESVAWISERKNVLSGAVYLAATLAYLRVAGLGRPARQASVGDAITWHYVAAILFFLASLFSKSVTCTWPAAMMVVLWWKQGRVARAHIVRLAPLLVVGAALGLWTAWVERRYVGAEGATWSLTLGEHVVLAGRILCFYVSKLLWPEPLMFIYPRWVIDAGDWSQWVYPLLCVGVIGSLIACRRHVGRGPLAGVLLFAGTLFPALGLFNVYFMRFSFVADHFQYLASIGVIALLTGWLCKERGLRVLPVLQAIMLVVLGVNTWSQATSYICAKVVWSDTLSKNPNAWLAHNNLAVLLEREGSTEEAEKHFRAALALHQDLSKVHGNLGSLLADRGDMSEAMLHLREAIRLAPESFDARFNLATGLLKQGTWTEAKVEYEHAIRLRSSDADAHFGLGTALKEIGDREGAAREYRETLRIAPDHEGARRAITSLAGAP